MDLYKVWRAKERGLRKWVYIQEPKAILSGDNCEAWKAVRELISLILVMY
jgi:hypothetical protein